MATGDKVVTLDGLKAVYDSQDTNGIKQDISDLKSSTNVITPLLMNGYMLNRASTTAVHMRYVAPKNNAVGIMISTDVPLLEGYHYYFQAVTYPQSGIESNVATGTKQYNDIGVTKNNRIYWKLPDDGNAGFAISINERLNTNVSTYNNLRVESVGTNALHIKYIYSTDINYNEDDAFIVRPKLRNGSTQNAGNANGVCCEHILPTNGARGAWLNLDRTLADGDVCGITVEWHRAYGATTGTFTNRIAIADPFGELVHNTQFYIPFDIYTDCKGFAFAVWHKTQNSTYVQLRAQTDGDFVTIRYDYDGIKPLIDDITNEKAGAKELVNARHASSPLTLLHFSDIHADSAALKRIMKDYDNFGDHMDGAICTGDIVGSTSGVINSWWDNRVMTCVGNHDTASYNSSTGYNWTALSMANRDTYYIAPYESNWGITHTAGTSYYYKDYADAKVRLIVMDGMLYINAGAEATAQTTWLEGLLASAITNNLHVLIAIHSPHGGAVSKACSFSKYGRGSSPMPTNTDCNTPQTIIDTVAAKITSGLKFIGYLCGHTHQDDIWDAEGDGTQLMYCVTCAAVTQTAQWTNSDQYRDVNSDAYNLITIDTSKTLVKIVRGGGADIDDHMRTRKAICINYSTGTIVGEVL